MKKHLEIRTDVLRGIEASTRIKLAEEMNMKQEELPEYEIDEVKPIGQERSNFVYYVIVTIKK